MITRRPIRTAADRRNINAVATELVRTYGPVILEDACRFSACQADADDAYQRALEILITKSPTTDPEFLIPWIRTIARREATAISRKRQKSLVLGDDYSQQPSLDHDPESRAEMLEEAARGIEALSTLTDDQVQCLVAHAEGYTYDEIAEITGFSNRKVTRCVTEGRSRFLTRAEQISSGTECERIRPTVDRFASGDQSAALAARAHLRGCSACREHLRRSRLASKRVRAIFPPGLFLLKAPPVGPVELTSDLVDSTVLKLKGLARHSQEAVLSAGSKQIAAVALIGTVAIGGLFGLATSDDPSTTGSGTSAPQISNQTYKLVDLQVVEAESEPPRKRAKKRRARRTAPKEDAASAPPANTPQPEQTPTPQPESPTPVDDGSAEFLPEQR